MKPVLRAVWRLSTFLIICSIHLEWSEVVKLVACPICEWFPLSVGIARHQFCTCFTSFNHCGHLCVIAHQKFEAVYWNLSIFKNHKTGLFTFRAACRVKSFPVSHVGNFGHLPFQILTKNCYISRMHWRIVTKRGMCLRHNSLNVLITFCGSTTSWSNIIIKFPKILIAFD